MGRRKLTEPFGVDHVITSASGRPAWTEGSRAASARASSTVVAKKHSPLRPEYVLGARGRRAAQLALRVLHAGDPETLLHKWSVPVLAELADERRFSELRAALPGVTPRALALALQELESAGLLRREIRATRPPSTAYRPTAAGRRVQRALD